MANRKRNVAYVDQEEPAFLKQFKQRVGYKEAPDVNAKFQTPAFDDSDDDTPEADDEKPQVVVLKKGDLTAAEAEALTEGNKDGNGDDDTSGKIVFKKPVKRQGDSSGELKVSSKKTKESDSEKSAKSEKLKKKLKDKNKKIKNTKLLSFDAEEED